jgi:hypothetical protein
MNLLAFMIGSVYGGCLGVIITTILYDYIDKRRSR